MRPDDLIEVLIRDPVFVRAFEQRVARSDGCWNWTGTLDRGGYGRMRSPECLSNGKTIRAHRFALSLHLGRVDRALFTLHSCANRRCCNPAHLRFGTGSDNVRDTVLSGAQGNAKLAPDDVRRIFAMRADGLTCQQIAREFAVGAHAIRQVLARRRWAHVSL